MIEPLKISFIQTDLYWESAEANLANFEEKISQIDSQPDLIILPEMFNSGFSMSYSEPLNFTTHKWLKQISKRHNASVMGSLAITEEGKKYNRAICVNADLTESQYNKKHLFSLGEETKSFTAGNTPTILNIKNWRIKPLICYDLRFPVWSRNSRPYYDVLIYIASWPAARADAWKTLLKARAIENQCYVVGVNRIGLDGNNLTYLGDSMVISFTGEILTDAASQDDQFSISLEKEPLDAFRKRYPFLENDDNFQISDSQ
jgi:omega-amidase